MIDILKYNYLYKNIEITQCWVENKFPLNGEDIFIFDQYMLRVTHKLCIWMCACGDLPQQN